MCSAVYGCKYNEDGRSLMSASFGDAIKSRREHDYVTIDGFVTGYLHCGLCFLTMMAILGALVAWNILSLNVLAVIGGQHGVEFDFQCFFCLKP